MGPQKCLLLALVAGAVVAGPINVEDGNQQCARTCTESLSQNAKFQYAVGTTYRFSYAGEAVTRVEGSSADSAKLRFTAAADVEVLSQCEFALKLREVRLLENEQTSASGSSFSQRLEANALRFSFQDGRIDGLCPDASEDDRVLNLKRGVLSAFQNSLPTLESTSVVEEEDVSGVCNAEYVVERGVLGGYTVKKSKDLLSCTNRNGNLSSLQSETYRVPSSVQSLPLMSSTHSCEQRISSGILQSVVCKEQHVFRPFSKHSSGAKTTVESSLRLDGTQSGVSTRLEPVQRRSSLLFQHGYDSGVDASAREDVVATLEVLCDQARMDVRPATPEQFGRLVHAMKKLSLESMIDVRSKLSNGLVCSSGRATKFFMDAVPLVGTAASVAFTRDLIRDGTVGGAEADFWLTQLAFIQQPTVQMLAEIKPLMEDANLRLKAVLGVSSLVHKVCSTVSTCQRHPDVAAIMRSIEQMLGSNCNVNDADDRLRVMYALKALGNAGRAVTSSSVISACASNSNLEVDIRVAALQAFRRLPCSLDNEAAMRLFQKADEDAELRINAYLAVMSCPTSDNLLKVKMALSGEVVNQVGSFVWTHLTNLQETASLFKQDIRNILQDAKLREDYDCDARKYSHNYEKSFFSDYLNIGGQVESNVIFSQKSWIPRSAMLNLTVDMFGNSINLLEVGGRVQGLETILEKFFGKNGYFSQNSAKSLMRNKRDVNHNIASIFDRIFKIRDDKLKGGLYMKALGNELLYKEVTPESFAQNNINFLDLLMKLAEPSDIDFTHSSMFLDATLVIPTMIGMPLNLTVNGTAMLSVQVGGKADVRNAGASPRSLDISGHIKPSAAIVISGTMSVQGLAAQSTLRVVTTMHTSTAVEAKLQIQDGEVLNAELKMPKDKMEIVSVETKILMNGAELKTPIEGRTEVKRCSSQWLSKVAGIELCAEASVPPMARDGSGYFPLTGPLSAKVVLNQKDNTNAYVFEARYQAPRVRENGVDYLKRLARLSFDTPGSTVDRKMLMEVNVDEQKMAAGFSLITPWKKVSADSELINLQNIKKATARLTLDGEKYYAALAEMNVDSKKSKVIYSPRIEIHVPGQEAMTATGAMEMRNGLPSSFDVTLEKFTSERIKLAGTMSKLEGGVSASASVNTQWANLKAEGSFDLKRGLPDARLSAEYSLNPRQGDSHRMSMSAKLQNLSSGSLAHYTGSMGLTATEFPWLEFSIRGSQQFSADNSESELAVAYGQDKKTFAVKHLMNKSGALADAFEGRVETSVTYAPDFSVTSVITHRHSPRDLHSSAELTYGSKKGTVSWNLSNRLAEEGVASGVVAVSCPGVQLRASTEVSRTSADEYRHTISVENGAEKPFEMTNVFRDSAETGYQLSGTVSMPHLKGPLSYSGQIRMKLEDFLAKAEVSYIRRKYAAETTYKMAGLYSASGTARLSVPGKDSNAKFDIELGGSHKTATVELRTQSGRAEPVKVILAGEYNNVDTDSLISRDSVITVTLPSTTLQMSANVRRADRSGAGAIEIAVGEQRSRLSAEYDTTSGVTSKIHLSSPHIRQDGINDIDIELRHSIPAEPFSNYFTIAWSPADRITVDTKFDSTAISWSSDVTTPFAPVRSFGSSLRFNADASDVHIEGRVYRNDKEATASARLNGMKSGSAAVVLHDGRRFSGSFEHEFANGKLKNKIDVTWGADQQLTVDTNVGLVPDVVGTVSLSTPFAALRSAVVSFDHQGKNVDDFASLVSVSWDGKQVHVEARHGNGKASARLSSPWQTVEAECTYAKGSEAMSTTGSINWSPSKTVSWSANLDMSTGVSADFSLTSPFERLRYVQVNVMHRGSEAVIETRAELSWDPSNRIVAQGKFASSPSIEGSFSLDTPFSLVPSARVTFAHSGSRDGFNSQATVDYASYEQVKFESKYNKASASASLSGIPSDSLKSVSVAYGIVTRNQKSSATGSLVWNGNQKISFSADRIKQRNSQTVSFSVSTPFEVLTAATGKVIHSGSLTSFTNQAELTWGNDGKMTAIVEFSRQAPSAKVDVSSPFGRVQALYVAGPSQLDTSVSVSAADGSEVMSVKLSHKGQRFDFENTVEVTWTGGKSALLSAKFKYGDDITGELRTTCPWSKAALKFSHSGSPTDFRSSAEASLGEQDSASITARFSALSEAISGVAELRSTVAGFENTRLEFNHNGTPRNFNNRAAITWANGREVIAASRIDLESPAVVIEVDLSSPVVVAKIVHRGNLRKLDSSAELTWGTGKRVAIGSKMSVAEGSNGFELEATLSSPFTRLESWSAKAVHRRTTESAINDYAEISWAAGKKASIDSNVDLATGLTALVTFKCPACSVNAFINHSGSSSSFNSNAGVSWENDKKIEASMKFSSGARMTGTATLSSPFDGLRNLEASFSHARTSEGFQSQAAASLSPSEKVSASLQLTRVPEIKLAFEILSPIMKVKASAEHSGNLSNFANKAEMSWSESSSMNFSTQFSASPNVMLTARFNSPFTGFEALSFDASHAGALSGSFSNSAELSWAAGKRMSLTTTVNRASGINVSSRFVSPFQNAEATLVHEGNMAFFNTEAGFLWGNDKRVNARLNFDNRSSTSITATVTSSFESARNLEAAFNHRVLSNGFDSDVSMTWAPSRTVSGSLRFEGLPELKVRAQMNSPLANIVASAEHSGTWSSFSNKAELSWAENKKISVSSQFAMASDVTASVMFSSPFDRFEALSLTASHSGALSGSFSNSLEFSWATDKKMSLRTTVNRATGINVSSRFASPFENAEATLVHEGNLAFFKTEAGFSWGNNKRIGASLNFDNRSSTSVRAAFTSPFESARNLDAVFNHQMLSNGFDSDARVSWAPSRSVSGSLRFEGLPELKVCAQLTSPLANIVASAEHSGTWSSFSNTAELSWAENKKISASTRFEMASDVTASAIFSSPFVGYETLSLTASHSGAQSGSFSNSLEFSWATDKKMSLNTTVNRATGINFSSRFASPFENAEATLVHEGNLAFFKTEAGFSWGNNQRLAASLNFDNRSSTSIRATFTSPFASARNLAAAVVHRVLKKGFECDASMTWAPSRSVSGGLRFEGLPELKVRAQLNSPLANIVASAEHSGTWSSFSNTAELSWAENQKISASTRFAMASDVTASAVFSSPFDGLEALSLTASHSGALSGSFSNSLEFSWATGRKMSLNTTVNRVSGINFSSRFASSFENAEATLVHEGNLAFFKTEAGFSWGNNKRVDAKLNFDNRSSTSLRATFTSTFESARNLEGVFNHRKLANGFDSEASMTWAPSRSVSGSIRFEGLPQLNVRAQLNSPFNGFEALSLTATHSGDRSSGFNTEASLDYAPGKAIAVTLLCSCGSEYKCLATLSTPFDLRTLSIGLNAKKMESSLESTLELNWNSSSFKLATQYGLTSEGVSGVVEATVKGDVYRASASASKTSDRLHARLSLSTPFDTYKDNKLEAEVKMTESSFTAWAEGQIGDARTLSRATIDLNKSASGGMATLVLNSPLLSRQHKVELSYLLSASENRIAANIDVASVQAKASVSLSKSSGQSPQGGSLVGEYELNGSRDAVRFQWSHMRIRNQYKSSFSAQLDSKPESKLSWISTVSTPAKGVEIDINLKTPFEVASDAKLLFKHTGDSREFSMNGMARLRPDSITEWSVRFSRRSGMRLDAEIRSPFDVLSSASLGVRAQVSAAESTLNIAAAHNGREAQLNGQFKMPSGDDFDGSLELSSPIEGMKNLKLEASCKRADGILRPYAKFSWAADKQIVASASLRDDRNSREMTLDISTPFEAMTTMHMETTHVAQLPESINSRFELKTNTMTEKLSASISYDRATGAATLLVSSPWRRVSNMQLAIRGTGVKSVRLDMNGSTLASATASWNFESIKSHSGEITVDIPVTSTLWRFKVDNLLDSNVAEKRSIVELEYSRGKVATLTYSNRKSDGLVSLALQSPFSATNFAYNLKYIVSDFSEFTEETNFTSSIIQFSSNSEVKLRDGVLIRHSCSLTYGGHTYTTSKTLTATGSLDAFSAALTCRSNYMPHLDVELEWAARPTMAKAKVNGFSYELTVGGSQALLKAEFPYRNQKETVSVTASVESEKSVRLTVTTPFAVLRTIEAVARTTGSSFVSEVTYTGLKALRLQGSLNRSAAAYSTLGEVVVDGNKLVAWNGKLSLSEGAPEAEWESDIVGVRISARFTPIQGRLEMRRGQGAGASIEFANTFNDDAERVPVLTVQIYDTNGVTSSYQVRGLYKNVGRGVVRDFKLHLQTPRELGHSLDIKLEFSIKSTQFVPGDALIQCSVTKPDGSIQHIVNLNAEWGNNGIQAVVRDPWPMKYEMKFNVNTRRQAAEITANWNLENDDSNIRIDFSRAGTMNSQTVQETTEARVLFRGSSYAVRSELDWQKASTSHKLKLDISGDVFGYEFRTSNEAGQPYVANVKLITPLRSVLLESSTDIASPRRLGQTLYLSWDADRDVSKKVGGEHVIRWESNRLWMETTFHHPALTKDVRVIDEMAYNVDGAIASFKKTIDYSDDEQKRMQFSARVTPEEASLLLTQPYNNINFDVSCALRTSRDTLTASGKLVYMTSDGSNKNFEVTSSVDVNAMVANLEASSPQGTLALRGILTNRSSADGLAYSVVLRGDTGNGSPVTTTVDVNQKTMLASIKILRDSDELTLSAGRFNSTAYSVEMFHVQNGVRRTDGLAAVSLNADNIFNGRLYWNPENYLTLKGKIEMVRRYLKESIKAFADGISTEISRRRQPSEAEVRSVVVYSRREIELLQIDAEAANRKLSELYARDVLFVRSIGDSVSQNVAQRIAALQVAYNGMEAAVSAVYTERVAPVVDSLSSEAIEYWNQILSETAEIRDLLSQVAETVGARFVEKSLAISEKAAKIRGALRHYMDYIASESSNQQPVDVVRGLHSQAVAAFNTYSDAAVSRVGAVTSGFGSRIVVQPEQASRVLGSAYDLANARIYGYLESLISRETVADFGSTGVERIRNMYRKLDIERHVNQIVAHAKEMALEYLNNAFSSGLESAVDGTKWIRYDPASGDYEFDLRIPSLRVQATVDDVRQAVSGHFNNAAEFIRSRVPAWKVPSMRLRAPRLSDMMPPYDAYATISGQHIQTFDRRHYDFVGSCSYLLARDFEDGNFTLAINYDAQGSYSIAATDDGKTIELLADGSVKVDGGKVELPVERASMTVVKADETVRLVNSRGLTVTCLWSSAYCIVRMDGWYFAKTAGLLGTYNNEASDDFTTSDNRNVTDVMAFTSSWRLDSTCDNVNKASTTVNIPMVCSSMFESPSSPLGSCFSVIDSSMYTHMCADAAAQNRRNPHCAAAQLYSDICRREGVNVVIPSECTSCTMVNGVVKNSESARITNSPSTADVVFVVEEMNCGENFANKMQFLVGEMETAFSKKGMRSNRYGIVGFGGDGIHEQPHTHTFDSQTMTTVERFRQGADALQFSAQAKEQSKFAAIRYAANYRFREGAAKVVVLLSCSNCSRNAEDYSEVLDLLRSLDISLHVVMEHNFDLVNQEKKAQTSALFGVDHAAVYTMRDARNFTGDRTQHGSVRFPNSQCFSMALQSGGSFFDLRMLKEKPQVAKNFQKVLALRVAATAEPGDCQVCTCRADGVNSPRTVCSKC